jgi:lysozyme
MTTVNPRVVDLSHWDPAYDYKEVLNAGIIGVIYKATEGQGYTDDTYMEQRSAAKAAGLLWGAYHFADAGDVKSQALNFLDYASPDPDELFCLDWEDNGGDVMSADNAKHWITLVEDALERPGECVIYSGNTAKEMIDGNDSFFGERRLWLAQYGSSWTTQQSWAAPWLWQFTDGIYGPEPHAIPGIGPCDINSYDGNAKSLAVEWASGSHAAPAPRPPRPPRPSLTTVTVNIAAPGGVQVRVLVNDVPVIRRRRGP